MTERMSARRGSQDLSTTGSPMAPATAGWLWTLALGLLMAGGVGFVPGLARSGPGDPLPAAAGLTTVQVDAAKGWQTTGVTAAVGTRLRLEVTAGEWTYTIGVSPWQPGTGDDYICANVMPASVCVEPMPYERKGALLGRIAGGSPFLVGQRNEIAVMTFGPLELRINDPDPNLSDNDGVLTVTIGDADAGAYPAPTESAAAPSPEPGESPTKGPARELPEPRATETPAPTTTATPIHVVPRVLPPTGGGGSAAAAPCTPKGSRYRGWAAPACSVRVAR